MGSRRKRTIGGKSYGLESRHKKKSAAHNNAAGIRKHFKGNVSARVQKDNDKYGVYVRKN